MKFNCLMWCGKMTINIKMGTYPTLLKIKYHVRH